MRRATEMVLDDEYYDRKDRTAILAYFDDDMMKKSLFEQEVISGFEAALREGQFCMYLQPLVFENGDIRADVLKIDMSLLRGIESEQRNRAIVASIISMAGSLGMDVITEGVETGTQLKSLIDMGCHRFQGYYFSCPLTVEEFEAKYTET